MQEITDKYTWILFCVRDFVATCHYIHPHRYIQVHDILIYCFYITYVDVSGCSAFEESIPFINPFIKLLLLQVKLLTNGSKHIITVSYKVTVP